MSELLRGRSAAKYIFVEMLPGFLLGVLIFIFILLMFQALRLTEFVLIHGADLRTAGAIILYLTISFLPAVLPMSLLFSVLLSFSRFSSDSEIVAFKAVGLHMGHLTVSPIILGTIIALFSAHTSFYLAPWGNRQFEILVTRLGSSKAAATIREGTFSEGFFDLVVYAQEVDAKTNELKNVFIYDERDNQNPVTIIAKSGRILGNESPNKVGATLQLANGHINRTNRDTYTKINFEAYDINLTKQLSDGHTEKSLLSHTLDELRELMAKPDLEPEKRLAIQSEYHKRWAISLACILFSVLGVGLGTVTHRRTVRSGSLVMSLGVIIVYWTFYVVGDNLARSGTLPAWAAIWAANFFFTILSVYLLRRAWN